MFGLADYIWIVSTDKIMKIINTCIGISIVGLNAAVQHKLDFTAQFPLIVGSGYRNHCRVSIGIVDQVAKQYCIIYHRSSSSSSNFDILS